MVLTIGQYQILVADACSALNSRFSLSAAGLLYLYLMRYRSWLHNGLILASHHSSLVVRACQKI